MRLLFRPAIPLGGQLTGTTIGARKIESKFEPHADDEHVALEFTAGTGPTDTTIYFKNGIALPLPSTRVSLGQPSSGMKVASYALEGNTLRIAVDVQPNTENTMQLRTERRISEATGAKATPESLNQYRLNVATCNEAKQECYRRCELTVRFRK